MGAMVLNCPQCSKQVPWEGNPDRPFCSERCRMIDLGAWIEERYRVPEPGDNLQDEDD
jgi:endogenous inhibitor of DNA gyrase (YacG/DUF329 family)